MELLQGDFRIYLDHIPDPGLFFFLSKDPLKLQQEELEEAHESVKESSCCFVGKTDNK